MTPAEASGTVQTVKTKTSPDPRGQNVIVPTAPDPEHWLEEIRMCLYSVHIVQ